MVLVVRGFADLLCFVGTRYGVSGFVCSGCDAMVWRDCVLGLWRLVCFLAGCGCLVRFAWFGFLVCLWFGLFPLRVALRVYGAFLNVGGCWLFGLVVVS